MSETLKLFISYSSADLDAANDLVVALEASGFSVRIDRRDLPYGEEWQKELSHFIQTCDTVIWLVSPASIASRWCNWELGEVVRLSKRLVPVTIAAVDPAALPEILGKLHLLPARGVYGAGQHLPTLVLALTTDAAWLKEGTRLADRAREWAAGQRDRARLLRGRALRDAEAWTHRQPRAAPSPSKDVFELILASKQGATLRQRLALSAAVAVMLLSMGLAGAAVWQWRAAERNFGFSIDASEELAIGLAQDMREVVGVRTSSIDGILKRADVLYDKLLSAGGGSVRLLESQMWMQQEMAKTYLRLGDIAAARARIEAAVATARAQIAARPADRKAADLLVRYLLDLAAVERQQGRVVPMRAVLDEALARQRQQSGHTRPELAPEPQAAPQAAPQADLEADRKLVTVLRYFANNLQAYDLDASRAAILEIGQIAQRHSDAAPDDYATIEEVSDAAFDVASFLWSDNKLAEARDAFGQVIALDRRKLELRPAQSRQHLLRSLQRFADLSSLLGDHRAALGVEREALDIVRGGVQRNADSYQAQLDLSFALMRVAGQMLKLGERSGVAAHLDEGYRIAQGLADKDPGSLENRVTLVETLNWLGAAYKDLGDHDQSLKIMRESIAGARKMAALAPDNADLQFALATLLPLLGDLESRDTAIQHYEEAIARMNQLMASGRVSSNYKAFVAFTDQKVARARVADRWPEAPSQRP